MKKVIILGSPVGLTIKEIIDSGEFAPNEIINSLVFESLDKMDSYILDGYPRRLDQAEMLGDRVDVVILIDVDEITCIRRICARNEGRRDDNDETARKRYNIYKELTAPIVDFYNSQGKLKIIDGSLEPELVFRKISEAIGSSEWE